MKSVNKQRGFTLIEILIVVVIIGIAAVAVSYTVQPNVRKQAERFANHLINTLYLVEQYAILTQTIVGVNVRENQLEFLIYSPDEKNPDTGTWLPIQVEVTEPIVSVPNGLRLSLVIALQERAIESEEARKVPEIIFSMNGRVTPFEIRLILANGELTYRIRGDVSGQINGFIPA